MTAERFRCPVCHHWCNWADGFGWVCDKRGGCGSEWPEADAAPDAPADGREPYTGSPELAARAVTDPAPIGWRCEAADTPEGCDWINQGKTDAQRMNDASQHWIGYGWPHVVRPIRQPVETP